MLSRTSSPTGKRAIKSQALADFIADWEETQQPEKLPYLHYWSLHFDGSKNADGAGAGIVLTSPKGDKLRYILCLDFTPCTNNMAEYEALLHGMRAAKEMNVNRLRCYGDSLEPALRRLQERGRCRSRDSVDFTKGRQAPLHPLPRLHALHQQHG